MQKWEYLSIDIDWDDQKRDFYYATFNRLTHKSTRIDGFTPIFDHFGEDGWELVSVIPDPLIGRFFKPHGLEPYVGEIEFEGGQGTVFPLFLSHQGLGEFWAEVHHYRAFFKRPKS